MRWLTVALALSLVGSCLAAGENLLVNPSFEGELTDEGFGWSVRHGAGADVVEIAVDREVAHDGAASIRIRQSLPVYSAITQLFDTRPRTIYAAELWVMAREIIATGGGVRLFVGNERGSTVTAAIMRDYDGDGTWRKLTCVFNSGEREKMCVVPMLHNASGTVWFSRPSVREVTPDEAATLLGRKHGWSYVVPDPEDSFAWFGRDTAHVCRDFPSPVWLSRKLGFDDPATVGLKMILDLPEGIEVAGGYTGWKIESVVEGDRNIITLTGPTVEYCVLYLSATWQPGAEGEARLWLEWEGGRQEEAHTFAIRCIEVPRLARPKRMIAGLSGPPLGDLYPGDFIQTASRLGFNTVNMWTGAGWVAEPSESFVAEVRAYTDAGFWVSDVYSPMHDKWFRDGLKVTEDAQACDIEGTRVPSKPCPSCRGELYQRIGTEISNMAYSGISYAHLDEEIWNGQGICFCERCLGRWEQYRAERFSELPATSPLEFEAKPAEHPELHEAWTRFKCHMVTEMFAGWREMLFERVAETGAKSSPEPWFDAWLAVFPKLADRYFFLHDPTDLVNAFDHQVPMLYDTADGVRRELVGLVAAAGRDYMVTGLTAGEPGNGRQIFPPEELRATVLEAAFAPTMGYVLWTYHRSDLGTMVALARAHDIMARAEDVLLDGQPSKRLKVVQGDTLLSAFEHEGERLIAFVRDYDEPGSVTLRMVGSASWTVTDMDDGSQVAVLTGDEREFVVDLGEANARVLECIRRY